MLDYPGSDIDLLKRYFSNMTGLIQHYISFYFFVCPQQVVNLDSIFFFIHNFAVKVCNIFSMRKNGSLVVCVSVSGTELSFSTTIRNFQNIIM